MKFLKTYNQLFESVKFKFPSTINSFKSKLEKIYKKVYFIPSTEVVKVDNDKFYGVRCILPNGRQIRFNSNSEKVSKVESIDFFPKGHVEPTLNLVVKDSKDNTDLISKIVDNLIDNKGTNESLEIAFLSGIIIASAINFIASLIKSKNATVKKGKKEKVYDIEDTESPQEADVVSLDSMFDGESKSDKEISPKHQKIANYTQMLINKKGNSLILCGEPGTGKTFTVLKTMWKNNLKPSKDFVRLSGKNTPLGLYIALYEYNGPNKIIVFDDMDSLFKNADGINILKAAVDSYDDRIITYKTSKRLEDSKGKTIPSTFNFTGRCIFVTNLPFSGIDSALKSRSYVYEMTLSNIELIAMLKTILPKMKKEIPLNIKEEAFDLIVKFNKKNKNIRLNTRTLIKAINIRASEFPDYAEMIEEQCQNV